MNVFKCFPETCLCVLTTISLFTTCNLPRKISRVSLPERITKVPESSCVLLSDEASDSVHIQYLGCGGLYIEKGNSAFLIDPFFSNPGLFPVVVSGLVPLKTICSDKGLVLKGLARITHFHPDAKVKTKAIFVTHSHYDHLMDVPAVQSEWGNPADVYLNRSGSRTCANVLSHNQMKILEDIPYGHSIRIPSGKGMIRVYPIRGEHNPHVAGIKAFSSNRKRPLRTFTNPYQRTRAWPWREGQTYNYLVDYVDSTDTIRFRAYVQPSSCEPEKDIFPVGLLEQKRVDMAILGVASHHFSKNYPQVLLDQIRPSSVMWIHWEDFFGKQCHDPETVRMTNVPELFEKKALNGPVLQYLPNPGADFCVKF